MGTETGLRASSWYLDLPHRRLLPHLTAVKACDNERLAALLVYAFDLLDLSYKLGTRRSSEHEMYGALRSMTPTMLEEVRELRHTAELLGLVREDERGYYLHLHPENGMSDDGKRIAEALLVIRCEERICRGGAVEEPMGR